MASELRCTPAILRFAWRRPGSKLPGLGRDIHARQLVPGRNELSIHRPGRASPDRLSINAHSRQQADRGAGQQHLVCLTKLLGTKRSLSKWQVEFGSQFGKYAQADPGQDSSSGRPLRSNFVRLVDGYSGLTSTYSAFFSRSRLFRSIRVTRAISWLRSPRRLSTATTLI